MRELEDHIQSLAKPCVPFGASVSWDLIYILPQKPYSTQSREEGKKFTNRGNGEIAGCIRHKSNKACQRNHDPIYPSGDPYSESSRPEDVGFGK